MSAPGVAGSRAKANGPLKLAVPRGALLGETLGLLDRIGVDTSGPRGDSRSVRENCLALVERLERCADVDLDPSLLEVVVRVLAELLRDLGEDPWRRVHEHPALRCIAQTRVEAQRVPDEVRELRERLDAGVPGPDEDERQVRRHSFCVE